MYVDSYNFDNKSVNMIIILRWLSQGSRYCHSSRFDPPTTIPKSLIKGRIAVLTAERKQQIEDAIRFSLDLP